MVRASLRFLISHRLLLAGLPELSPLLAKACPATVRAPLPLAFTPDKARLIDGSGVASERFEEAVRARALADLAEAFAKTFFAEGTFFSGVDLAAALSFSR
jgi:hypothetical protein